MNWVYRSGLKPSKVKDSEILDFLIDNQEGGATQVFGYDNSSQVRIHIRRLRNNKNIDLKIGSSSKGYYLPREDEEMEAVKMLFEKTLSHRNAYQSSAKRCEHLT